jgi:hypothetical protein
MILDPRCKRFHRVCDDFSICVNIGEKGYVLAEHPNERYTSFYYPVYGNGKFAKLFENEYLNLEEGRLYDVQEYLNSDVIFQAKEDFNLIGFNTNNKNIKWKAQIINTEKNKFNIEYYKSYLMCLNGKISINGKNFKKYDYALLDIEKEYIIDSKENSVVAVFTQIT